MGLKHTVKIILTQITGHFFFKELPHGTDPYYDIKKRMTGYDFKVFIDVGANIGQTANQIREAFPKAVIHSVEPLKETYLILQQNTKGKNVLTHNIALGSKNEIIEVKIDKANTNSAINSMQNEKNKIASGEVHVEMIQVIKTIDFCKKHRISHIDYLKIDTEGYDLEVIKGAKEMLDENAIGFVEVEVGMNKGNKFHISLEEVKIYMEDHNYLLFGLYEQVLEWKTKAPVLRRSNAVFISAKLAEKYGA